ncbi:MAG: DUF2239 family protein [Gemmatimonadaceae bacterium]|jgi:hypothetical protein|nr:DUF2239 family protein [Gemmatimonadaceae bacterium]
MPRPVIAFAGAKRVAQGDLPTVARAIKEFLAREDAHAPFVFDLETSQPVELDLRGNTTTVVARARAQQEAIDAAASAADEDDGPRGPGRPRLGVIGREVTLLKRHWDWLGEQPGGASAALRRLVDQARVTNAGRDRLRRAQDVAYRFASQMLGDQPDFEEATRALFAHDRDRFLLLSMPWPRDLRDHARDLAELAFSAARAIDA